MFEGAKPFLTFRAKLTNQSFSKKKLTTNKEICAKKILLVSMCGQVEGQACTDPGFRNPIRTSRNSYHCGIEAQYALLF